jgi:mannose-6-phosphate isomerase-like protein (cupin superfamily)
MIALKTTLMALAITGVAAGSALAASPEAAKAVCPPTTAFTTELDHLDGYRVFTGPDGFSKVEPLHIDSRKVGLLKTGKTINILSLSPTVTHPVGIVVGPANADLPVHPAPFKEMFVLLGGSVTVTAGAFKADLKPGAVLLFEDTDSKDGHGGRTGPCGYISLDVAP